MTAPLFIARLINKVRICWRSGHEYRYEGETLGGEWIRCKNCNYLEEYLPGLHEPKGYVQPERK